VFVDQLVVAEEQEIFGPVDGVVWRAGK